MFKICRGFLTRFLILLIAIGLIFMPILPIHSDVEADSSSLVSLKKSAAVIGGEKVEVNLDLSLKAQRLSYDAPKDYIFVMHSTGSSNAWPSNGKINGRAAVIEAIETVWEESPNSTITIAAYGREAFKTNTDKGLEYDYVGSNYNSNGRLIRNEILGYKEIPANSIDATLEATVESSFYNSLDYYRITKNEYPNGDSTDMFNEWGGVNASTNTVTPSGVYIEDAVMALPYADDTNTEAGLLEVKRLLETDEFARSNNQKEVVLITTGQANRSFNDGGSGIYLDTAIVFQSSNLYEQLSENASLSEMNRAAEKARSAATSVKNTGAMVSIIALDATPQTSIRGGGTAWSQEQLDSEFLNWSSGTGYFHNASGTAPKLWNYMNHDFTVTKVVLPLPFLTDSINNRDFDFVQDSFDSRRLISSNNGFVSSFNLVSNGSGLKINFNETAIKSLTDDSTIRTSYDLDPKNSSILSTNFSIGNINAIQLSYIMPRIDEITGEIIYDSAPITVSDITQLPIDNSSVVEPVNDNTQESGNNYGATDNDDVTTSGNTGDMTGIYIFIILMVIVLVITITLNKRFFKGIIDNDNKLQ